MALFSQASWTSCGPWEVWNWKGHKGLCMMHGVETASRCQVFLFPLSGPTTQQLRLIWTATGCCAFLLALHWKMDEPEQPIFFLQPFWFFLPSCGYGAIFFEVSPMGMIGGVPVGMQMPGCEAVGRIFLAWSLSPCMFESKNCMILSTFLRRCLGGGRISHFHKWHMPFLSFRPGWHAGIALCTGLQRMSLDIWKSRDSTGLSVSLLIECCLSVILVGCSRWVLPVPSSGLMKSWRLTKRPPRKGPWRLSSLKEPGHYYLLLSINIANCSTV